MERRRNREECTRLLTLLVSATQRLIKPYALPMLRVLILKANDPNSTVAANVLMCLGELACVGGEDAIPHVPELMEIILTKLADPSIAKRDAALHALGQVCSSAGYVIQPLVEYPQLLQIFGRILKSESNSSVRREVIKVLGIIGALDPYRRKVRHIVLKRGESKSNITTDQA
jgi:FKBP12-rapamycin complex-associated protein